MEKSRMKIRSACIYVCILSVVLLFCSCSTLSWKDLERQPSRVGLVVLPTNEQGGAKMRQRFAEYAEKHWAKTPRMTDVEFINLGAPVKKGIVVLGTEKGNLFLSRIVGRLPLELSASGVTARSVHAGDSALWITWPDAPLLILTGTTPEAVLSVTPQMEAEQDYLVLNSTGISETGYFQISEPARPLNSPMYAEHFYMVFPDGDARLAGKDSAVIFGGSAMGFDFSGKSALVWGTRENNCFLNRLAEALPVKIADGVISARGVFAGPNYILYAKVPSPSAKGTFRIRMAFLPPALILRISLDNPPRIRRRSIPPTEKRSIGISFIPGLP